MPRLGEIRCFLETSLAKISGKSELPKAIRYAHSRSNALVLYTDEGRLKIGLFAGPHVGGERAATLYTLIETAKLNGLDPEAYLRHVLALHRRPSDQIDELPWNRGRADPEAAA